MAHSYTTGEKHILARLKARWTLRSKVDWGKGYAALLKGKQMEEVSYNCIKSLRNKGRITSKTVSLSDSEWRLAR